jgi:Glycosyl transferase family 90
MHTMPYRRSYAACPCCSRVEQIRSYDEFQLGSVFLNLGDVGYVPGLAFCDSRSDYFLIPDPVFVSLHGYAAMRREASERTATWHSRTALAFWRGGTSGPPTDTSLGWQSLPRVVLCRMAESHPDLIDAGITHIGQMPDSRAEEDIQASGLMRPFVASTEFIKYKYQIDIDGNTNSWPGLFQKLLTGSPVLKVASRHGYRQWYYDRLRPWVNFVPVLNDMSDLVEKLEWLKAHDDIARQIGLNGHALATSLSYQSRMAGSRCHAPLLGPGSVSSWSGFRPSTLRMVRCAGRFHCWPSWPRNIGICRCF